MGLDDARLARIAAMAERVRPFWEPGHDPHLLQERLMELDCHGIDAVLVTKELMRCDLGEAQRAFFSAPCREDERRFHNEAMDALARTGDCVEYEGDRVTMTWTLDPQDPPAS
ncbi:hypothetical protein ACIP98_16760 [Streptomyces sp. NPDC088354]|uniref:hypothetical protein n=1 Tax=unclassified Streptomyces TaxID=2593676 RepID=UPI0029A63DD1|nr:hypothetical protein [Streptomyces sp. MI02-7b]MDX3076819.1 hypothetical protein [Streptomyces sp. MI02-7b]